MFGRLLGILLLSAVSLLGCFAITERHYLAFSDRCQDGDSLCCTFEQDSVRARVIASSTDGHVLMVGIELLNLRTDTLLYPLRSISAWENGERLREFFEPGINGMPPCVGCTVMTVTEKPSYVHAAFERLAKKDKRNSAVVFDLGVLYRDTVRVSSLGTHMVLLDRFTTEEYFVRMKLGLH
ncbi:MAG: hypothetical protein IPH75_04440 [bacterium]|nr:hypothetical protein [bacterium]